MRLIICNKCKLPIRKEEKVAYLRRKIVCQECFIKRKKPIRKSFYDHYIVTALKNNNIHKTKFI